MRIPLLCILLLSFLPGWTQERQGFRFTPIIKLSDKVNTIGEELMPIPSPDGQVLYFVRSVYKENIGGKLGGQDIWLSEADNQGDWKKARKFTEFNNAGNNAIVGIEKTGKRMFLLNSYETKIGDKSGLSYSDISNEKWSYPTVIRIQGVYDLGLSNDYYGLAVNRESDVLMVSMAGPESLGNEDLYVSFKFSGWNRFHKADANTNKEGFYWWSTPIHLGSVVNSTGFELSPFLCEDGVTLYFASNRPGGYGNSDIYYSKRLDDTWKNWSEPINLGSQVNSKFFEGYFYLNETDSSVFFSSSRGGRFSDIYQSNLLEVVLNDPPPPVVVFEEPVSEPEPDTEEEVVITVPALKIETPLYLDLINDTIRSVFFDHDSYNLLLRDHKVLETAVIIMVQNPKLIVHLVGHTDAIGGIGENERLSRLRSQAVKDYLTEHGVKGEKVTFEGAGEDAPIGDNSDKKGRELNRRVDLYFTFIENLLPEK